MLLLLWNCWIDSEKKGEKCWLPAFTPVCTMFWKAFIRRAVCRTVSARVRPDSRHIFLEKPPFHRAWFYHYIRRLTHHQTTNFRLFQTERVYRRQFQIWRKWQQVIQTGRKHSGKRRNCSLRAISPFPTVFFKRLVFQGRQKKSLCGNGLKVEKCVKPNDCCYLNVKFKEGRNERKFDLLIIY